MALTSVQEGNPLKIALVGSPNVGKSALFNQLTKRYVSVSNYPGTTVSLARGKMIIREKLYEVIDTPGMYSLLPITDEERVSRKIIFEGKLQAMVHVVDAKNLERMLPLTLQLQETGLPLILALNMSDEAEKAGIEIQISLLEKELRLPVIKTVSTQGVGIEQLKEKIYEFAP